MYVSKQVSKTVSKQVIPDRDPVVSCLSQEYVTLKCSLQAESLRILSTIQWRLLS